MIGHRNFFDQSVTFQNIRKIVIGQGDDYTAGCVMITHLLFQTISVW